jgi:hypothetical protein
MKIKTFTLSLGFVILFLTPLFSMEFSEFKFQGYNRPFYTKEEFYSLYRENMYRRADNYNANIFWLEQAKKAPFGIPVKALAKIETKAHWLEYQRLFLFHINFLIMDNYLKLGEQYEKPHILFFNTIFKKEIKEGFQMAQIYYNRAKIAFNDAMKYAKDAWENRDDAPMTLDGESDKWIDTIYRMLNCDKVYHEYNYNKEITMRLNQVANKIKQIDALK